MSSTSDAQRLNRRLSDPQARSRFKTNQIKELIASQIRLLREQYNWTQAELGDQSGGVPQPRISLLEDPDNAGITLKTLLKLSDAFDVGLIVRFAPYSELVEWTTSLTPERLTPASHDEEVRQQQFSGSPAVSAVVQRTYETFPPMDEIRALNSTALSADYSWDVQNAGSDSATSVQTKEYAPDKAVA